MKKLAGRKDVEDAFQRLDRLTPEEVLMAAAESMAVTRDIDDTVKGVDKRLVGVDERVHRIDMKTEGIEDKVQGVDSRVGSVIQGRLFFPQLAPESVLTPYSFRYSGDWGNNPTGVQSS